LSRTLTALGTFQFPAFIRPSLGRVSLPEYETRLGYAVSLASYRARQRAFLLIHFLVCVQMQTRLFLISFPPSFLRFFSPFPSPFDCVFHMNSPIFILPICVPYPRHHFPQLSYPLTTSLLPLLPTMCGIFRPTPTCWRCILFAGFLTPPWAFFPPRPRAFRDLFSSAP